MGNCSSHNQDPYIMADNVAQEIDKMNLGDKKDVR